ncbi:hypothetical protein KKC1_20320 [Calderihabitans maritimus]|uniref:Uncharacterized protein n=1 Tax=Calderihabitans maritimus TaxID=1246530 RepID=A0A1Z5HU85_9FIRM|nr:hypothetical protein KKC1_20320 [Calderihabitans maritimus]
MTGSLIFLHFCGVIKERINWEKNSSLIQCYREEMGYVP